MGTCFDRVKKENIDKSVLYNSKSLHWIPLSFRHFENALVVSQQYRPRGIRWGDPQQGGERGSYLISPQAHSFRLKEIKSILAKSN